MTLNIKTIDQLDEKTDNLGREDLLLIGSEGETLQTTYGNLKESLNADKAVGIIWKIDNSTPTTFATQDTFVKANIVTEAGAFNNKFETSTSNRLVYTGEDARIISFSSTFTLDDGAGTKVRARFRITPADGSPFLCPQCEGTVQIPPGGAEQTAMIQALIPMNTGDHVEVWIANASGTAPVTVINLNVKAVEV